MICETRFFKRPDALPVGRPSTSNHSRSGRLFQH